MPLDTGAFADGSGHGQKPPARPRIALDTSIDVGAALRAARQSLGLTLGEIAETTRVRERHLAAIEAGLIDQLPSRPFSIGYVRAYATALGADADATAARFRAEFPSPDDELRTPVGVRHNRVGGGRNRLVIGLVLVAGAAVLGWNVTRHVTLHPRAAPSAALAPRAAALARVNSAQSGPFNVDAPLPAPPDAMAPAPYITPVAGAAPPSNAVAADAAPTPFDLRRPRRRLVADHPGQKVDLARGPRTWRRGVRRPSARRRRGLPRAEPAEPHRRSLQPGQRRTLRERRLQGPVHRGANATEDRRLAAAPLAMRGVCPYP